MRSIWGLQALLRLVIASQPEFSVRNDLLAFPQYEVVFAESFVSAAEATELLTTSKRHEKERQSRLQDETLETHLRDDGAAYAAGHDLQTPMQHDKTFDPESRNNDQNSPHQNPSEPAESYERLVFNSRPHLCSIPHVKPFDATNGTAAAPTDTAEAAERRAEEKKEKERELVRATNHGWELLKGMQGHCLYYAAGWWVYSLCYNDPSGIRQFHPLPQQKLGVPPVEDPAVQSYVLGRFDAEDDGEIARAQIDPDSDDDDDQLSAIGSTDDSTKPKDTESKDASANKAANNQDATDSLSRSRKKSSSPSSQLATQNSQTYLVRHLGGGTICDLTGRPRRVSVQFHCNPNGSEHIAMIKEIASCVYLMVIHTPRLCNDVAFLPPTKDIPNPITCREIIDDSSSEALQAWKQRKDRHAEALLTGSARLGEVAQDSRGISGAGFGGGDMAETGNFDHLPKKDSGDHLIIGGVALGAQKLVGGDESRTIKASSILFKGSGGGANGDIKVLAQLAESDGKHTKVITQREMNNLGLDKKGITRDKVDESVKQLEQQESTQGLPWRLNLVQTPRGLEFTYIVLVESEEELAATAKAANSGGKSGQKDDAQGDAAESKGKTSADKPADGTKGDKGSEEEYK